MKFMEGVEDRDDTERFGELLHRAKYTVIGRKYTGFLGIEPITFLVQEWSHASDDSKTAINKRSSRRGFPCMHTVRSIVLCQNGEQCGKQQSRPVKILPLKFAFLFFCLSRALQTSKPLTRENLQGRRHSLEFFSVRQQTIKPVVDKVVTFLRCDNCS